MTTQVIVRISSVAVPESKASPHLEYVQTCEIPRYEGAKGFIGIYVLQRLFVAYVELMTIEIWQSEEALKEFVGDQSPADRPKCDCGAVQLPERIYDVVLFREGKLREVDPRAGEKTG